MNLGRGTSAWIRSPRPKPSAALRLFCFPYAGGGASAFAGWPADLPVEVELCAIQLPGREDRHGELPFRRIPDLVDALFSEIAPCLDRPFAFFGHSMGSLIAFELAHVLRSQRLPLPQTLFVGAHRAPHLPLSRSTWHDLPDEQLIRKVGDLGRVSLAVLRDPSLAEYALPLLRADFEMCDTYSAGTGHPLECDLVVYGGREDSTVTGGQLAAWSVHTRWSCTLEMLPGDHFFLQSSRAMLLKSLSGRLVHGSVRSDVLGVRANSK
jgi:medium-chain acyl-[acyl-carrier-protein] hydrolase